METRAQTYNHAHTCTSTHVCMRAIMRTYRRPHAHTTVHASARMHGGRCNTIYDIVLNLLNVMRRRALMECV